MIKNRICDIENFKNNTLDEVFGFNCGGFAFNRTQWYRPYDGYDWCDIQNCYYDCTESYDQITEMLTDCCVDYMMAHEDIRKVISEKDLKEDEYLIAFRVGLGSDDFHFRRRSDEGIWFEKNGYNDIHRVDCSDEDFFDTWYNDFLEYDGPIQFFAVKKG